MSCSMPGVFIDLIVICQIPHSFISLVLLLLICSIVLGDSSHSLCCVALTFIQVWLILWLFESLYSVCLLYIVLVTVIWSECAGWLCTSTITDSCQPSMIYVRLMKISTCQFCLLHAIPYKAFYFVAGFTFDLIASFDPMSMTPFSWRLGSGSLFFCHHIFSISIVIHMQICRRFDGLPRLCFN